LLVYDPDAPTGSGWWHWQLVNIRSDTDNFPAGAGNPDNSSLPEGSLHIRNDYSEKGFRGACPTEGHGVRRYQFTLHALPKTLEQPKEASGSLTGYMVNAHSLGSSTIEALYQRNQDLLASVRSDPSTLPLSAGRDANELPACLKSRDVAATMAV
jgi:Raf kinase inhibitor-like YbhB/YbcL family protein